MRMLSIGAALAILGSVAAGQEEGAKRRAREVKGILKKIDPAVGSVEILQAGDAPQTHSLSLARGVKVTVDGKDAALADLAEGMHVFAALSDLSEDVLQIRAEGPTINASLRAVDADARTLTLAGGEAKSRTFPLAPAARVTVDGRDAKLGEFRAGARVTLRLSSDMKTVLDLASAPRRDGDVERRADRPKEGEEPRREDARPREGEGERKAAVRERPRELPAFKFPLARVDANGDGTVSKEEWEAFFAKLDRDRDGKLSTTELTKPAEDGERRRDEEK